MTGFSQCWYWDGFEHAELYRMVRQEARGPAAVAPAGDAWTEFVELMHRCRQETEAAVADAGVSWEGLAGESMTSGVMPLAQWAGDASFAGESSTGSVRTVSDSFGHASFAMPEPVPVTSTANLDFGGVPAYLTHLFGGQTDQDAQEQAAQEAKQRAVDLMNGYTADATSAVGSVGAFTPPQRVTVAVAEPEPEARPVETFGDDRFVGPVSGEDRPERRYPGIVEPPARPEPPVRETVPPTRDDTGTDISDAPTTGRTVPPITLPPTQPGPVAPPGSGLVGPGPVGLPGGGRVGGLTGGRPGGLGPVVGRVAGGLDQRGGAGGPRGGLGDDGGRAGRGPIAGALGPQAEQAARGAAGGRAGAGMGMGMAGAGAGARPEEDGEHVTPAYLHDTHDDFWDDHPPVAPPVIGE